MLKVVIVMPAYNAEKTLERTFRAIPAGSYHEIILVDDASRDNTAILSERLGITTIRHQKNKGYGGNQKTCYKTALAHGADIVIMLHPDFQYDPTAIPSITKLLTSGTADFVIASRFAHTSNPYTQGMPLYKYIANRFLTTCQNIIFGLHLSEYHSGYRAYTRKTLESIPFEQFSDNFVFDSQMVAEAAARGIRFKEIGIETRYFDEASQTSFKQSLRYGISTVWTLFDFLTRHRRRLFKGILILAALGSAFAWSLALPQGRPYGGDALEFHSLGISILEQGKFGGGEWFASENPSMWREPGYPAFLALLYGAFGQSMWVILTTQSILFALSAALFFSFASRLTIPTLAGVAAFLYAINPALAYRAGYVGSDLPFVIAILFFIWFFLSYKHTPHNVLIAGGLLGITVLIRTISLFLPICVAGYFIISTRKSWGKNSALFLIGFCALTLPWIARNTLYFGSPSITNRSGLMLHSRSATLGISMRDYTEFFSASFLGDYITHALFPDYSKEKARRLSGFESRDYEVALFTKQHLSPSAFDAQLKREGIQKITSHPFEYIRDFIPNLARLNAPNIPRRSSQAILFNSDTEPITIKKLALAIGIRFGAAVLLITALFGFAWRIRKGSHDWLFLGGIIVYFNILYAAFAPVERFSLPLLPLYLLGALEGLRILSARFASHPSQNQT